MLNRHPPSPSPTTRLPFTAEKEAAVSVATAETPKSVNEIKRCPDVFAPEYLKQTDLYTPRNADLRHQHFVRGKQIHFALVSLHLRRAARPSRFKAAFRRSRVSGWTASARRSPGRGLNWRGNKGRGSEGESAVHTSG